MTAWHGEQGLKDACIARLEEDRRYDRISQGVYWENGRGCNLGCLTRSNEDTQELAERLFGIPQKIGYWLEAVFEGLPFDRCEWWVIENAKAIPVGADLRKCHHHLATWLFDESTGINTINDQNRAVIARVRELHMRALISAVTDEEWRSAEWSAARSAARTARSAAGSAAGSSVWTRIAQKSLEIFAAAPVVNGESLVPTQVKLDLCNRGIWCPQGLGDLQPLEVF